jgi:hypothetical protein
MSAKKTRKSYTWAKGSSGQNATRIDNKTKQIETFFKKDGEWRSTKYPLRKQPQSVQKKAALISKKRKGFNVEKAFKVLGRKRRK